LLTTKSILVFAGIVTWNVVGVVPRVLVPGSPRYLAAVAILAGTNGARNAATWMPLPVAVGAVNVIVTHLAVPVLFDNLWVL